MGQRKRAVDLVRKTRPYKLILFFHKIFSHLDFILIHLFHYRVDYNILFLFCNNFLSLSIKGSRRLWEFREFSKTSFGFRLLFFYGDRYLQQLLCGNWVYNSKLLRIATKGNFCLIFMVPVYLPKLRQKAYFIHAWSFLSIIPPKASPAKRQAPLRWNPGRSLDNLKSGSVTK